MEVRAVVADLHAAGPREQVACGVPEPAVGLAGGAAADAAALGVVGARGDAAGAQGVGVDDAAVTGGVHDVHLAVGGDAVEVVTGGVAALGEPAVLVAEAAHGDPGGKFAGRFGEDRDEGLDVGYALGAAVHPGECLPVHHGVAVGVDEAGVDEAAVEVEGVVGPAAECGAGVVRGPDVDDPTAADGQCLGSFGGPGGGDGSAGHQERAADVVEGVVHERGLLSTWASMREPCVRRARDG